MIDWRKLVDNVALSDGAEARASFLAKHHTKIKPILKDLASYYERFEQNLSRWPSSDRTIITGQFLHAAGNTLLTSTQLLVSCLPIPAGHLMRQHAESVAMALLCATPACGVLEAYLRSPSEYAVHKAVHKLTQAKVGAALEERLRLSKKAWVSLRDAASFLDNFSHMSVIAVGHQLRFGRKAGGIILGSHYDPQKFSAYRQQIRHLRSASRNLAFLLGRLDEVFRADAA